MPRVTGGHRTNDGSEEECCSPPTSPAQVNTTNTTTNTGIKPGTPSVFTLLFSRHTWVNIGLLSDIVILFHRDSFSTRTGRRGDVIVLKPPPLRRQTFYFRFDVFLARIIIVN